MFRKKSPDEQAAKREEKAAREQERAAKYAEKQAGKVARKKAQQEAMEAAWEKMRQENLELLTGMLSPNETVEGVFHTADPLMKKTLVCTSQRLLVAVIGGKQIETIPYSSIRSVRMGSWISTWDIHLQLQEGHKQRHVKHVFGEEAERDRAFTVLSTRAVAVEGAEGIGQAEPVDVSPVGEAVATSATMDHSTSALEIARERYARGEISRDEFLQVKSDLVE